MTHIDDDFGNTLTDQVAREGITAPLVLAVIREAEDRSRRPFRCDDCAHRGQDDDGSDYGGGRTWPVCNRHPALSAHPSFPFPIAPAGCFAIGDSADAYGALTYGMAFRTPGYEWNPGTLALRRCTDARGRLTQSDVTPALVDALALAMTGPIEWESDDDDDPEYAEARWRGMTGHAGPAPRHHRKQVGHEQDYSAGVVGDGVDLIDDAGPYHPQSLEDAKRHAEVAMREIAIRRLIAESGL